MTPRCSYPAVLGLQRALCGDALVGVPRQHARAQVVQVVAQQVVVLLLHTHTSPKITNREKEVRARMETRLDGAVEIDDRRV